MNLFPAFCEIMVPLIVKNIEIQLEGGAEIVMIFDTAAGNWPPGFQGFCATFVDKAFREF